MAVNAGIAEILVYARDMTARAMSQIKASMSAQGNAIGRSMSNAVSQGVARGGVSASSQLFRSVASEAKQSIPVVNSFSNALNLIKSPVALSVAGAGSIVAGVSLVAKNLKDAVDEVNKLDVAWNKLENRSSVSVTSDLKNAVFQSANDTTGSVQGAQDIAAELADRGRLNNSSIKPLQQLQEAFGLSSRALVGAFDELNNIDDVSATKYADYVAQYIKEAKGTPEENIAQLRSAVQAGQSAGMGVDQVFESLIALSSRGVDASVLSRYASSIIDTEKLNKLGLDASSFRGKNIVEGLAGLTDEQKLDLIGGRQYTKLTGLSDVESGFTRRALGAGQRAYNNWASTHGGVVAGLQSGADVAWAQAGESWKNISNSFSVSVKEFTTAVSTFVAHATKDAGDAVDYYMSQDAKRQGAQTEKGRAGQELVNSMPKLLKLYDEAVSNGKLEEAYEIRQQADALLDSEAKAYDKYRAEHTNGLGWDTRNHWQKEADELASKQRENYLTQWLDRDESYERVRSEIEARKKQVEAQDAQLEASKSAQETALKRLEEQEELGKQYLAVADDKQEEIDAQKEIYKFDTRMAKSAGTTTEETTGSELNNSLVADPDVRITRRGRRGGHYTPSSSTFVPPITQNLQAYGQSLRDANYQRSIMGRIRAEAGAHGTTMAEIQNAIARGYGGNIVKMRQDDWLANFNQPQKMSEDEYYNQSLQYLRRLDSVAEIKDAVDEIKNNNGAVRLN